MRIGVQMGWLPAVGVAVGFAVGCASVERDTPQPLVPETDAAATNACAVVAACAPSNAVPPEGYAWETLARLAATNCAEAKALFLDAAAERHETAVDTGWRNPQLRAGERWGDDREARVEPNGAREWGDGSFDGVTSGLRVYASNPFVNRWLRRRGEAAARALEARAEEASYAVFCEVRSLCLEAELARVELELLERMAELRQQARDFRKEQVDAGVTDALELVRAETRLAALRAEIRERRSARAQVLRRIALFTGVPADQLRLRPLGTAGQGLPEALDVAELVELAVLRRPDLAHLRLEQEAAEHKLRAARAGNIPWFEYVEGSFEDEDGTSSRVESLGGGRESGREEQTEWEVRVAVTLPVFNWLGDEVKRSRALAAAAAARADGLYATIRSEVGGVLQDYREARVERDRLQEESRALLEALNARIDAAALEAAVKREDVLAAREELAAYQRVCLKAERECLRMEQYLETVSGGPLAQER